MKLLSRRLPPLHTLIPFEAVARLESFTRAADELCVTQSAVSKQVKILEEYLGIELFSRQSHQTRLTEAGRTYFLEVQTTLLGLVEGTRRVMTRGAGNSVTIAATVAVAHYWLLPRISRFRSKHPDIKVNIFAMDDLDEAACLQADLCILYGSGKWKAPLASHYLFPERIYAVCATSYPLTGLSTPHDLLKSRLIHLRWRWSDWSDWFLSFGIRYEMSDDALVFNQVPLAINAALEGLGIALGWEVLIRDLIESGQLRLVLNDYFETGYADYLVYDSQRPLTRAAELFHSWILEEAVNTPLTHPAPAGSESGNLYDRTNASHSLT